MLSNESFVLLYGVLKEVPGRKSATREHELQVNFQELFILPSPGVADSILNEGVYPDVLLDNRCIAILGENTSKIVIMISVMT